jgi:hypothetical protein
MEPADDRPDGPASKISAEFTWSWMATTVDMEDAEVRPWKWDVSSVSPVSSVVNRL